MTRKNVLSQVAALSEDALGKLAQNPTAARFVQSAMELKERVDDLTRRVRGLEALEQRLEALEQRVDALQGGAPAGLPETPGPAATAATTTKSSGA
jgi:polyhydroxyalkanoate synthesis regulator phasin